jgi:hypothetical protein
MWTRTGKRRLEVELSTVAHIKIFFLQLKEKVKDTEQRKAIYHQLCVLRWERDVAAFEKMLPCFTNLLPDEFKSYFETYYVARAKKWALCYRNPELPDTTAHPESFHRVLKHVYMEGMISMCLI